MRLCIAFVLLCACGGRTSAPSSKPTTRRTRPDAAARAVLAKRLETAVLDQYTHVNLSNTQAYRESLARDRKVALLAPTSATPFFGPRTAAPVPTLALSDASEIASKNLRVQVSLSGEIGWVYDEVSYRLLHDERIASAPVRRTAVYLWQNGEWLLVLEHRSYPAALPSILAWAARGVLPDTKFRRRRPANSRAEEQILATIQRALSDGDKGGVVSRRSGAVWLLPGWDGEFLDARVGQAPALGTLLGPNGRVDTKNCIVRVQASGTAAWALCELRAANFLGASAGGNLPLWSSFVLERRDDSWQIQLAHTSVPVTSGQLSSAVFGGH